MSINPDVNKVKEWVLAEIESGRLKPSDMLPSLLTIARTCDVKTDDVQGAIHELVTEQIVTENFEEGARVKKMQPFFYPLDELMSVGRMITDKGYREGTVFLSLDEEPASRDDCRVLKLEEGTTMTVIERIRTADDSPVVYCLDKVAENVLQYFDTHDQQTSIFKAIESATQQTIAYAETEIEAISYEPYISEALEADPHDGLMLLKQVHYTNDGKPILYSLNYFKSSLVKFKTVRKRQ
ncbi:MULTISPECIES: GntR family transcriptional regulator [unclassified Staphylococcus]|uniref:GntR family transcriptional regulator n=1 Tax=unclassified Staphylococcus TaxID=91994 RepID=UPI0021D085D8|nr:MULTISPECIES: GntR family transcriptional regulator [unclassified Staphylococcus]UXR72486.1 GntR family transcriptional regulator [Staphylococcus sp. IVB6240]UXR74789.1 GntR family transcriptional regulator [Staphylococcus sp. IVB6238]UXR77123.1 GntR family transcriptional regulator [Staphylococcus sp. IVB6233]UXR81248.1 GntR family transcriptional regulator [Staphylococcus sp. IVB6218]